MWKITSHSQSGGKDQDRFFVEKNPQASRDYLVGIFDGHGKSDEVVEHCRSGFLSRLVSANPPQMLKYLREIFETIAEEIATLRLKGGSTAAVAYLGADGVVEIGILGDSMVVANKGDRGLFVSPQHNVRSNYKEREAAINRGGVFSGAYIRDPSTGHGLQLGRACGDLDMGRIISHVPEILKFNVSEGDWVVVTSDGVLEAGSSDYRQEQRKLVQMVDEGAEAEDLVKYFQPRTHDDATAIVCRLLSGGEPVEVDKPRKKLGAAAEVA